MTQDPFQQQKQAAAFLSGGLVSAKFPEVGFTVTGTVIDFRMQQQRDYDSGEPLVWSDGSPRMQLVVDLQCEPTGVTWEGLHRRQVAIPNDTGMRSLYVKGNLQKAVAQALRDADNAQFETGGTLVVQRIQDGDQPDKKKAAPMQFRAAWQAPTPQSQAAGFLESDAETGRPAGVPAQAAPAAPVPPLTMPPAAQAPAAPVNPFTAPLAAQAPAAVPAMENPFAKHPASDPAGPPF
jgi:hypothetical protein